MDHFSIEGKRRLSGTVTPAGNKNAALPIVAACLLTDDEVTLTNVPDIVDVRIMLEILERLGAAVTRDGAHEWRVNCRAVANPVIPPDLAARIRASILFAGPLLARLGEAELPPPGGDVIGRRRLDTHFQVFTELGASFEVNGTIRLRAQGLRGDREIFLDEPSVTATENAIMAAVTAVGETVLYNVASEPHIQDLIDMLTAMGAKIQGRRSNVLTISGVKKLRGCRHAIINDHIEIASFLGLAVCTGSEMTIRQALPLHLPPIFSGFAKLGIRTEIRGNDLFIPGDQDPAVIPDLFDAIPTIYDAPWPGFPADLTSIAVVTATQTRGTVLIFEKMFESRLFFVDKLLGMGAQVVLCDPHRVVVIGRTELNGAELTSPDIRAGMAMLIAALCARGNSIIHNISQIDRGYERMEERLLELGAAIKRVK